jgi:uncharacterized protein YggE
MGRIILCCLIFWAGTSIAAEQQHTIAVQAEGYVEAVPDTLVLTVSLRKLGDSLESLQTDVDALTSRIVKLALAQGVAAEDIDSSRLSSAPEYEWRNKQRKLIGIAVQRDVQIKLRELDNYAELVRLLSEQPLHRLSPPQLSHSNIDELQLNALRVALARGKAKAAVIADEIGATLGPVLLVEELYAGSPAPQQRMMMAEAAMDSSGSPSFSFAKRRINAQVQIRYALQ